MASLAPDEKRAALARYHALNPHPETVTDPLFTSGNAFFDARDLVQVKCELIRRVQAGQSVAAATRAFGLSRPTFYQARAALEKGASSRFCPSGLARDEPTNSPTNASASSSKPDWPNPPLEPSSWSGWSRGASG